MACKQISYPENFPSTKFGTNDVYFFKTTAEQTLVIEAHVSLDDKWRGWGREGRKREVRSSFRFFNYKVLKRLVKNFNTFPVNSEISWILF